MLISWTHVTPYLFLHMFTHAPFNYFLFNSFGFFYKIYSLFFNLNLKKSIASHCLDAISFHTSLFFDGFAFSRSFSSFSPFPLCPWSWLSSLFQSNVIGYNQIRTFFLPLPIGTNHPNHNSFVSDLSFSFFFFYHLSSL